jgi:hypothetical protein
MRRSLSISTALTSPSFCHRTYTGRRRRSTPFGHASISLLSANLSHTRLLFHVQPFRFPFAEYENSHWLSPSAKCRYCVHSPSSIPVRLYGMEIADGTVEGS